MARKPKKGRFKYNLETVLKVRNIREKLEKEKFAKAQKEFQKELKKEEEIKDFQSTKQTEQKSALSGKISDFSRILQGHFHLGKVKKDVEKQEKSRLEAEQKKEEQREKLIKSIMDRKIMDKDKEKKVDSWRKLMNKEETKFLDDISTSRYSSKKK
ncbi:flagellar export protein FliJ [Candidatus Margulisiibacteriota bacterium]